MKSLLRNILLQLADGQWHSGQALADTCGVTRTAIWKASKELLDLGLSLEVVRQQGYRLAEPLELLDIESIQQHLTPAAKTAWQSMQVFASVDSTNDYLLAHTKTHKTGAVCLAEEQTEGRGRHGRRWHSPFGRGLILSVLWHFPGNIAGLSGLSLAAGVEIAKVLREYGIDDVQVKWPNDIYYQGKKLAGVLLEVVGHVEGPCAVVLGLGLNIQLTQEIIDNLERPCTDLATLVEQPIARNHVAALLLNGLAELFPRYQQQGFSAYLPQWGKFDALHGKKVTLQTPKGTVEGVVRGVQSDGALVLATPQGERAYGSGEVLPKQVEIV